MIAKFRVSTIVVLFALAVLFAACTTNSTNTGQPAQGTDSITLITTGTALEPLFNEIDSIAVMFYNNPFGDDAERYTRYYKTFASSSDSIILLLQQNMAEPFVEDTLRNCRSEGKMYAFSKGKVMQTVYFTMQSNGCNHLYFINTARYYYFKPTPALVAQLAKLKTKAKE